MSRLGKEIGSMPIYEYQCEACGQVLEKWQKFSEEPLKSCPACGGALSKLISSCAFHLKGSGWYVTDYCGNRSNSAAGRERELAVAEIKSALELALEKAERYGKASREELAAAQYQEQGRQLA